MGVRYPSNIDKHIVDSCNEIGSINGGATACPSYTEWG